MRTLALAILVAALGFSPPVHASTADTLAAWGDSARVWTEAMRWAPVDSVTTLAIRHLESRPATDTLALSQFLYHRAYSRWMARRLRDDTALADAQRAATLRDLSAGRPTAFGADARVVASRIAAFRLDYERSARLALEVARWAEGGTPLDSMRAKEAHHLAAVARQAQGRTAEARSHFERAGQLYPALAPGGGPMALLSDHALFLSEIGELDEAEPLIGRALALAERASLRSAMLENVLSRMSTIQLRGGDLAESVESAWRSYDAASRRMGPDAVTTLLARVRPHNRLLQLGDHRGAFVEQRDLLPRLVRTLGDSHPTTISVRLAYAEVLLKLGQRDSARVQLALSQEAMTRAPQVASSNPMYAPLLEARFRRQEGEYAAAREWLSAPITLERRRDPTGERASTLLGEYLATIRVPADSLALRRAVAWLDTLADSTRIRRAPTWAFVRSALARAEHRVGWNTASWAHALAADDDAFANLRQEVRALPDARALQLLERHAEVLDAVVASAPPGADAARRTWDHVARSRSIVRDEVARRRPVTGNAGDSASTSAHRRWLTAQRRLARLSVSGAAHPDDPDTRARWTAASAEAENAERAFARLSRLAPTVRDTHALGASLASLAPGEALVGFAISDANVERRLVAFVAHAGEPGPHRVELGPTAPIEAALAAWTAELAQVPGAAADRAEARVRRFGERVRTMVWTPLERALGGASHVFLVPSSPLEDLPWLALPAPRGRYLADEAVAITVLASEADVAHERSTPATNGLLVLGGPDFGPGREPARNSASRELAPGAPCVQAVPVLGALPGTLDEARAISELWREGGEVRLLLGSDALEAEFKRNAPGHRVVHLATHGIVVGDDCDGASGAPAGSRGVGGVEALTARPRRPRTPTPAAPEARPATSPWLGRRVWLALAGANGSADSTRDDNDGLLTAEEAATLDLRDTDWVVLSSCQSGAPQGWSREGVLGMRRAFHLSGANAVIASRWSVSDEATRDWMLALYAARAQTHSASAAVREASRAVLAARRARHQGTHPFWWAAFTASGD
ncbi:MAG: CHAT domain-containing protein [Candidatus Eisenbacteria bacterium]|nr:CHAT domain-containing protein [Candidatus Eisenbacteria bacterium]